MLKFGILLKSYDKDFNLAERLVESFNRFNPELLQMFIVVPEPDVERFSLFESDTITVLSESLLGQHLVEHEVANIRPGYINQEIVKLSFWELGLTENYFCVDSECVFVRDLSLKDFMHDQHLPYTVLVEDNDLHADPKYFADHWEGRATSLRKITSLLEITDSRLLTCHGHQVFSSTVLKSLVHDYMRPGKLTYKDLLEISPYEFSWYNFWLQKSMLIPIFFREPLVRVFHHEVQLALTQIQGVTEDDLARGYIGYVINSNFSSPGSRIELHRSKPATLASLMTSQQLASALGLRLLRKPSQAVSLITQRWRRYRFQK
jgi:hypothetical protein